MFHKPVHRSVRLPTRALPSPWSSVCDGIILLNLRSRADRLQHAERQFARERLSGCAHILISDIEESGTEKGRGCFRTHWYAMRYALGKGWKKALILEDDFLFTKNAGEQSARAVRKLPKGWYRLMLGSVPLAALPYGFSGLWFGHTICMTAYVASEQYMRATLDYLHIPPTTLLPVATPAVRAIDTVHSAKFWSQTYFTIPCQILVDPNVGNVSDNVSVGGKFWAIGNPLTTVRAQNMLQFAALFLEVVVIAVILCVVMRLAARCRRIAR